MPDTERTDIVERVKALSQGYLDENSIELVEIMYRREAGGMILRLLVDTPEGVTIAECERLNNYLSEALDKEEVIAEHFLLEVASPGLDRPLVTDRDFERVMAKELNINMYEPVDDKREHRGKLIGMDKENVVIELNGISTVIPRAKIAKAKLRIDI